MAQPEWEEIACTDFFRLLVDETGVYDPEVEIADEIGEGRYQLFRVKLERYKTVLEDGFRLLVPEEYASTWPHAIGSYQPWFHADLDSVATSCGSDRESLITQLCSEDPQERFWAYHAIAGYFGWIEFDQYPRRVSEEQLDARWTAP